MNSGCTGRAFFLVWIGLVVGFLLFGGGLLALLRAM